MTDNASASSSALLQVTGMTCGNCARRVTDAIQSVSGVAAARVQLDRNEATVRWTNDSPHDLSAVIQAVRNAGFNASPKSATPTPAPSGLWGISLLTGIVPTAALMLGNWALNWGDQAWFRIASFALALVVQAGPGSRFYQGAWRALKSGHSNMDTLVSLGSTTAFAFSTWILLTGQSHHLYFLESATIITLITVGHWLESRAASRASSALQQLLTITPATARCITPGQPEKDVPVSELQPDDHILLKPGDRVPCDGIGLEGDSAVDESMLTGEATPIDKQPGSSLYAGTVNLSGKLVMRVTGTGDATALAHIIAAVERAQSSRANIQRLADKVSSVFVPVVVLIAIATALWWGLAPESARQLSLAIAPYLWPAHLPATTLAGAIITAVAVLIVACPCAMGLATPAAIMAGSNAAAQRGILIRDGIALEKAGQITAVLFDKTGTLTHGKPTIVARQALAHDTLDFEQLIASLARPSSHPVSQAVNSLSPKEIPLAHWQEIRGGGVQATLAHDPDTTCRLGSLNWLRQHGIDVAPADSFQTEWTTQTATLVGVAANTTLLGVVALRDSLKLGARDVIKQLTNQGLSCWLISGDNPATAKTIASQCGIPEQQVFAEVRPEDKAHFVKQLQAQGERVAFVGDGINDAPALEQSDLGIAVSGASDIAREAADLILLNTEVTAVPESLGLARATLRTIKQNLFWAFCYNALAIPIAALGFMSPVLCAATMGLSDIIVIGNALRLRRWRLTSRR